MVRAAQCVNGILTIHDYDEADIADIEAFASNCKYLIYCKEVCPTTDRPHIHVVLWLKKKTTITVLHKMLESGRVVDLKFPIRATDPTNAKFAPEYCKKGEQPKVEWNESGNLGLHFGNNADFKEFGDIKLCGMGHRSDLDRVRDACAAAPNFRAVLNDHTITDSVARNLNWTRAVFDAKPPTPNEDFIPRPWQAALIDRLAEPADDRTINWMYDPQGASGKTTLAKFLMTNHGASYLSGKAADMFHAYDMEPIIIIDIPRADNMDYLNYGAIEKLKDGVIFSGKYNSCSKLRTFAAHVVVFSNHEPDPAKWTADRVNLVRLSEPTQPTWDPNDQFRP